MTRDKIYSPWLNPCDEMTDFNLNPQILKHPRVHIHIEDNKSKEAEVFPSEDSVQPGG